MLTGYNIDIGLLFLVCDVRVTYAPKKKSTPTDDRLTCPTATDEHVFFLFQK